MIPSQFPHTRLRRTRSSDWIRRLTQEHVLTVNDLMWPIFVVEGQNVRQPVHSLPGIERLSIDLLVEAAKEAEHLGIPAIALFPAIDPALKTPDAEESYNPDNLVCRAVAAVKAACPNLGIMCDIALDLYTSHGHDGVLRNGEVANDETVEILVRQALTYTQAGCDILGPSDMMDGRVGAIRQALEAAGHKNTCIFSYAAKYDSGLYGPYRDAVGSKASLGKGAKSTYQQHPANQDEALREVALDVQEGADALIIKPGSYYLDVIHVVKQAFKLPTIAYQVSGEYAMIAAAGANGWIDPERVMFEALLCMKRAGADAIITYAAPAVAKAITHQS